MARARPRIAYTQTLQQPPCHPSRSQKTPKSHHQAVVPSGSGSLWYRGSDSYGSPGPVPHCSAPQARLAGTDLAIGSGDSKKLDGFPRPADKLLAGRSRPWSGSCAEIVGSVVLATLGALVLALVELSGFVGQPFAGFVFRNNGDVGPRMLTVRRVSLAVAALRPQDRLVAIDGEAVASGPQALARIMQAPVGTPLRYTFDRSGRARFELTIPTVAFAWSDALRLFGPFLFGGFLAGRADRPRPRAAPGRPARSRALRAGRVDGHRAGRADGGRVPRLPARSRAAARRARDHQGVRVPARAALAGTPLAAHALARAVPVFLYGRWMLLHATAYRIAYNDAPLVTTVLAHVTVATFVAGMVLLIFNIDEDRAESPRPRAAARVARRVVRTGGRRRDGRAALPEHLGVHELEHSSAAVPAADLGDDGDARLRDPAAGLVRDRRDGASRVGAGDPGFRRRSRVPGDAGRRGRPRRGRQGMDRRDGVRGGAARRDSGGSALRAGRRAEAAAARLFPRQRRTADAVHRASRELASVRDESEVARRLATAIREGTGAGSVRVLVGRRGEPLSECASDAEEALAPQPPESALAAAIALGSVADLADPDGAVPRALRSELERLGVVLLVPLHAAHGVTGAFLLGPRRDGHPYSTDDRQLLETLAAQIGGRDRERTCLAGGARARGASVARERLPAGTARIRSRVRRRDRSQRVDSRGARADRARGADQCHGARDRRDRHRQGARRSARCTRSRTAATGSW